MAPDRYIAHATHRMLELDGVKLASFKRRAIAYVIDCLLVVAVFAAVTLGGAALAARFDLLAQDARVHLKFNFANWYSIASLVVYFGLLTFLGKGRTPGKRIVRIRVVSTLHPSLSLWHSIERALGYGASALELGFGYVQYFIADNRQTTHDRIAGTIVIEEPPQPRPVAPDARPA